MRCGDRRARARQLIPLRYLEVLLVASATAVAGLLYGNFFATAAHRAPLLAAAAGGALAGAVAATRRWGPWRSLALAVGGFVPLAGWVFAGTLWHGLPTLRTGSALGWGLVRGWMRMLTVGLPADVTGELLVSPVLLSWAATFAAAVLALRSRSAAAPVAPPLVAFVVALLLVASRPGDHLAETAGFLAVTLLLLLLRANRVQNPAAASAVPREVAALGIDWHGQQRRATLVRILRGLPVVVLLAALGAAGAQASPLAQGEDRFDPRQLNPPRLEVDDTVSPLAAVKGQLLADPPRPLFTVRLDGPGAARTDRIRVAALDEFDGAFWSSQDRFLLAGHELAADPAVRAAQRVSQQIEVTGLAGPYLPAAGWPVRLDREQAAGTEVWFSGRSGALVTDATSLRGLRYRVLSEVRPPDADLARARPVAGPPAGLPPVTPGEVIALAQQIAGQQGSAYDKLTAIERHVRALPYRLEAPPGHSYGALTTMLAGTGTGTGTGTSTGTGAGIATGGSGGHAEQHAAAFAVLARALGIPARVAVGYRLRSGDGGVHAVTTRDAHAWAEVPFEGYGWVPFEPTDMTRLPAEQPRPPDPPPVPGTAAGTGPDQPRPPRLVPPPVLTTPARGDQPGSDSVGRDQVAEAAGRALWAGLGAGGTGVLLAGLVVGEKSRRRWRRRRATGRAGCLAAWREATDRLMVYGVPVPPALTADEVAGRAKAALGPAAAALGGLAPVATAALYAPEEPDAGSVRRAWEFETQLHRDLRAVRGRFRRLRAALDPRPLFAGRRSARLVRPRLRGRRILGGRVTS